ncbi:MAG: aldose 1-epimerase [Lachnospirales bacterium]
MNRNHGCRITTDIVIKGNKALVMENQLLRLTLLLDRGTDIIELLYKPKDLDLMWRSPVPLHRKSDFISSTGNSLGNYLDHNSGGWQEILPNGGSECFYKGACLGMHGEISNIPWEYSILEDHASKITICFSITTLRSPFSLEKKITLKENDSAIYIEETLQNLAKEPMELMWGHHPTIGKPFLDESCKIFTNGKNGFTLSTEDFKTQRLAPNSKFNWPIATGKKGTIDLSKIPKECNNTADMIYLCNFPKKAEYYVHNKNMNISYGMNWNGEMFPYLWMWLVCNGAGGYPWYGRTYNLALEPWTSYSAKGLTGAIENKSALHLKEEEVIKTEFQFYIKED